MVVLPSFNSCWFFSVFPVSPFLLVFIHFPSTFEFFVDFSGFGRFSIKFANFCIFFVENLRGSFVELVESFVEASWSFVGDFGVKNLAKLNFSEVFSRNSIFQDFEPNCVAYGTRACVEAVQTEHLELPLLSHGALGL